jgi:transcription elongation factor Elf1
MADEAWWLRCKVDIVVSQGGEKTTSSYAVICPYCGFVYTEEDAAWMAGFDTYNPSFEEVCVECGEVFTVEIETDLTFKITKEEPEMVFRAGSLIVGTEVEGGWMVEVPDRPAFFVPEDQVEKYSPVDWHL